MERTRRLANPGGILYVSDPLPLARIRIGAIEYAHAILSRVVGHGEPMTVWAEAAFVAGGNDLFEFDFPYAVGNLLDRLVFPWRSLRGGNASDRLHRCPVDDNANGEHAKCHNRKTVAWMV